MFRGIDISHHNGIVNFQKVKESGISFVYIKATEGTTYTDDMFFQNVRGAKAAGLLTGAYHFARCSNDSDDESTHFVSVLRQAPEMDLLPVLDIETTENQSADHIRAFSEHFIAYMQNKMGQKTMVYTGEYFYRDNLAGIDAPLWIARYGKQPQVSFDMWQDSESGKINGVNGNCDTNQCSDLNKIRLHPVAAAPSQIGVVTCLTNLNLRDQPNTAGKVLNVLPKGSQWKVFYEINGWYNLGGNQFCSANPNYVTFQKK
jgi:lysozyme